MSKLTNQEKAMIVAAAREIRSQANEAVARLYAMSPDDTPLWAEQMTAAKNLHEAWGIIADKMALIQ